MSQATTPQDGDEDPLDRVRENRESFEEVGEGEDRTAAIARYFLALADGETPDDYDARLAGLPELGGDD
jgi:hypothetical protein